MKKTPRVILIGLSGATASLVEKYLQAGRLPNLAALIKRGAYTRVRSPFPGTAPVSWATVSTGTYPGNHGITGSVVLDAHDALDGGQDGFSSAVYQAETLWQAACRAGLKAATLNFPGADASGHANHVWIAGRGLPAEHLEYAVRQSACFATETYQVQLCDCTPLELKGNRAVMRLTPADQNGSGPELNCELVAEPGQKPVVRITDARGVEAAILSHHVPSGWLWGEFKVGRVSKNAAFRLELTHVNARQAGFAIYVSAVICPQDISSDPNLLEQQGPLPAYNGMRAVERGWTSPQRMIDEGRQQGIWQIQAARRLLKDEGVHLVLLNWTLLNDVQHAYWGGLDPLSPWYEPKFARVFANLVEQAYQAADAIIAELLPLLGQGVSLAVVGDGGHLPHIQALSINALLAENGLLQVKAGKSDPGQVDWSGTLAFGGAGQGQVWVNRQGERPQGVVKDKEYESVRQRVIDALLGLRDPQNGMQPVAKAMRREEARDWGLWGDRVGDVVFLMQPGFSCDSTCLPLTQAGDVISTLGKSSFSSGGGVRTNVFQSQQGGCEPGAALGMGTAETILVMAGAGIHPGAGGEMPDLTAVAPTLCRASGLPLPEQSEGQVLLHWVD